MTASTHVRQEPTPTGPAALAGALGAGLAMVVLVFIVVMAASGRFGQVLKGIQLSPPGAGPVDGDLAKWAVGVGVTAGVITASLYWRWSRASASAAPVGSVLAAGLGLGPLLGSGADWALTCLPATLTSLAFFGLRSRYRAQEPLVRTDSAPLLQLCCAVLLASAYAVVALVATRA